MTGSNGPHRVIATGPLSGKVALINSVGHDDYGEIVQAGRDLRYGPDHDASLELAHPIDELFKRLELGRLLIAVGLLISLAGFAGWAYLIMSAFTRSDGNQMPDLFGAEPFGAPAAMVAFGSFALGGLIAAIGRGMAKAARERAESEMEMRRARAMAHR